MSDEDKLDIEKEMLVLAKERNRFLHEGLNRIIFLLAVLVISVFILGSLYGLLIVFKEQVPYVNVVGFFIFFISVIAGLFYLTLLPANKWGKIKSLGHLWSDEEQHKADIEKSELWAEFQKNRQEENKSGDD